MNIHVFENVFLNYYTYYVHDDLMFTNIIFKYQYLP